MVYEFAHVWRLKVAGRASCKIVELRRSGLAAACQRAPVSHADTLPHLSGQRKLDRPDGLQTGSPPSPSPQLIRPSVRLLLRSPRFWVRVPLKPYAASLG